MSTNEKRKPPSKTDDEMVSEWMEDPKFKIAYDALEGEFQLLKEMLRARKRAGLTQEKELRPNFAVTDCRIESQVTEQKSRHCLENCLNLEGDHYMDKSNLKQNESIVVFDDKEIRKTWHNEEWWFSVTDVIQSLTDSSNSRRYWSDLKRQLVENEGFSELYEKIVQLKLTAPDGKMRETDCANTEGIFRIIQSIPSSKAEPFKLWLAKVGYERVQEIADPERASLRARELYRAKGYSEGWIEKRLRGIQIREELTDEWKSREVGRKRFANYPL